MDIMGFAGQYAGIGGILGVLAIAFIFSNNKRAIALQTVVAGLAFQFALAFLILKTDAGRLVFEKLSLGFESLYTFASTGAGFLFGKLTDVSGPWGMVFAFKLIPMIIFFGALMSLLFHLGIIQLMVQGIAFVIRPILGTSGAETLCAAANSMLGQTEAPLLIRNYLGRMTNSEILVVMVSGMGTISGSILAVYGSMGVSTLHMLSASVMAIPGSIVIAKILYPETEKPETSEAGSCTVKATTKNMLDAISVGTSDGMMLAANVAAMLIAFISIIALFDSILGAATNAALGTAYSLKDIFALIFWPLAQLIGIPASEAKIAGSLLGTKLVVNEFVAYAEMLKESLSPRSVAIITYALCGFSNFSCIGIQIGGIGALCPEKRATLTKLGLTALLGGTLTNLLSAAIAGLLL